MMSPEDSWVSKWQRISEWVFPSGLRAGGPFSPAAPLWGCTGGSAPRGGRGCWGGWPIPAGHSVFLSPGNFKPGVYAVSVTGRLPQGNTASFLGGRLLNGWGLLCV